MVTNHNTSNRKPASTNRRANRTRHAANNPIGPKDFMATICHALGIDPSKQNESNVRRPIRIAEKGAEPIKEIL